MLTVNELFSGIGAFRKALINLGVPHEIVGISEIDKYAIASYEAMYGPARNYGDIAKVQKLDYADMWTYGFPCQDISSAGYQKGIVEGETRSGLLYEVKRLLEISRDANELPKYLIMENVKALISKKFKPDFDRWIEFLQDLGYRNYAKMMNAKDYGIPQHRERIFVVSIRKDIQKAFEFPQPVGEPPALVSYLEEEVDEKFYCKGHLVEKLNLERERERNNAPERGEGRHMPDNLREISDLECSELYADEIVWQNRSIEEVPPPK